MKLYMGTPVDEAVFQVNEAPLQVVEVSFQLSGRANNLDPDNAEGNDQREDEEHGVDPVPFFDPRAV